MRKFVALNIANRKRFAVRMRTLFNLQMIKKYTVSYSLSKIHGKVVKFHDKQACN